MKNVIFQFYQHFLGHLKFGKFSIYSRKYHSNHYRVNTLPQFNLVLLIDPISYVIHIIKKNNLEYENLYSFGGHFRENLIFL